MLKEQSNRLYVEIIAIDKEYRNKGLGSSFLSSMIDKGLKRNKVDIVELVVEAMNDNAIKVYKNLGFVVHKVNSTYNLN